MIDGLYLQFFGLMRIYLSMKIWKSFLFHQGCGSIQSFTYDGYLDIKGNIKETTTPHSFFPAFMKTVQFLLSLHCFEIGLRSTLILKVDENHNLGFDEFRRDVIWIIFHFVFQAMDWNFNILYRYWIILDKEFLLRFNLVAT